MKGEYRATTVLARRSRLVILIICAVFLTVFPKADTSIQAESTVLHHPAAETAAPLLRQEGDSEKDELSPSAVILSQNFNTTIPPALPAGWTTAHTGTNADFTTVPADTGNPSVKAFTNNPEAQGSSELVTLPIALDNLPTRLSFRHRYVTEPQSGYDGGVLEISIAGGPFQDIVAAGGSFVQGAYV